MNFVLDFIFLGLTSTLFFLKIVKRAPEGWQDINGYHYGNVNYLKRKEK